MDSKVILEVHHIAFLLELLQTKGLAFTLDKARVAVEVFDRLSEMQGAIKQPR